MSEAKEKSMYEIDLSNFTNSVHVISEPGDMTRYDYYIIVDGDDYIFFTVENTFNYPRKINYYEINDIDVSNKANDEKIALRAAREQCNPCTLKECIRSMQELF